MLVGSAGTYFLSNSRLMQTDDVYTWLQSDCNIS